MHVVVAEQERTIAKLLGEKEEDLETLSSLMEVLSEALSDYSSTCEESTHHMAQHMGKVNAATNSSAQITARNIPLGAIHRALDSLKKTGLPMNPSLMKYTRPAEVIPISAVTPTSIFSANMSTDTSGKETYARAYKVSASSSSSVAAAAAAASAVAATPSFSSSSSSSSPLPVASKPENPSTRSHASKAQHGSVDSTDAGSIKVGNANNSASLAHATGSKELVPRGNSKNAKGLPVKSGQDKIQPVKTDSKAKAGVKQAPKHTPAVPTPAAATPPPPPRTPAWGGAGLRVIQF